MKLLHYSHKPVTHVTSASQDESLILKPNGFWISVDDEWKQWCIAENFRLDCLNYVYEVTLAPKANILRISDVSGIDEFTEKFVGAELFIQWNAVAQLYSGIIIAPYIWERRMSRDTMWYYGWDCASGCIWDADAIADIRLIAVERSFAVEESSP
jgi:hypothetical protein